MANMLYVSWLHSSAFRLQAQSLRSEGASVQRLGSAGCGFVGVCGWLLALLLRFGTGAFTSACISSCYKMVSSESSFWMVGSEPFIL